MSVQFPAHVNRVSVTYMRPYVQGADPWYHSPSTHSVRLNVGRARGYDDEKTIRRALAYAVLGDVNVWEEIHLIRVEAVD